jgi:hypothetical protein
VVRGESLRARGGATIIHPATLLEHVFPEEIRFVPKSANLGAELADVPVTSVGRDYLGRSSPISPR